MGQLTSDEQVKRVLRCSAERPVSETSWRDGSPLVLLHLTSLFLQRSLSLPVARLPPVGPSHSLYLKTLSTSPLRRPSPFVALAAVATSSRPAFPRPFRNNMVSFTSTLLALLLLASAASAGCNGKHSSSHRRHHSKASGSSYSATRSANAVQWTSSAASSTASSSAWQASSSASSTASASSSSSTASLGWGLQGMKKNQIAFGWLPDDGE